MGHVAQVLDDPDQWVLFLTEDEPHVLIVFVHGFGGSAVGTWKSMSKIPPGDDFWRHADLLFVDYDSLRDSARASADDVRRGLDRFYPHLDDELRRVADESIRDSPTEYDRLILVGHSLGGLVLRIAKLQAWIDDADGSSHGTHVLAGELRLFSPATGGFEPSGWLGVAAATSSIWGPANKALRFTETFAELNPDSEVIATTRDRTVELLASGSEGKWFRARSLWARPDHVVRNASYFGDRTDIYVRGRSHSGICKTTRRYSAVQTFVEKGEYP